MRIQSRSRGCDHISGDLPCGPLERELHGTAMLPGGPLERELHGAAMLPGGDFVRLLASRLTNGGLVRPTNSISKVEGALALRASEDTLVRLPQLTVDDASHRSSPAGAPRPVPSARDGLG